MNTYFHKHMLNDTAIPYITKKENVILEKTIPNKVKRSFKITYSICPQYGSYFNFCPFCAYNNTKNDFRFCLNCGTSLEIR